MILVNASIPFFPSTLITTTDPIKITKVITMVNRIAIITIHHGISGFCILTIVTVIAPGQEREGNASGTSAISDGDFCFLSGGLSPNCSPLFSISSPTNPKRIPPAILSA